MFLIKHVFTCSVCNNEFSQSYASDRVINPIAILPAGWAQLPDNGYVCDRHILTITDKPQEEPEPEAIES